MGRGKNNKPNKKKVKISKMKTSQIPLVSVCTPTFNRRPFIEAMIKCFDHQTYPKDKMEWIIIDDGTDKVGDLLRDHPNVKYFEYDEKMTLGKKRNLMHEKSKGDIIVYMDDDDYYPPERVSHAVEMLLKTPKALCAGSSEIYIYFKHISKMYKFGPYGPNHATAGTFAFRRELLKDTKYNEDACLAEEKEFLKNYSVPFVQLDPKKVILVFSHEHNTFDKRKLLVNIDQNKFVNETFKKVEDFVKEQDLINFYMNVDDKLKDYEPGNPKNKPDVIKQTKEIEETRKKMQQEAMMKNGGGQGGQIMLTQDGKQIPLNNKQVVEIIQKLQNEKNGMLKEIERLNLFNKKLLDKIKESNIDISDMDKDKKKETTQNIELTEDQEKDVNIVMQQANVSKEKAYESLKKNNFDIVDTIMELNA
jgi:glycosyltransferase involved in cell wall biosynthesis/NACalpha-BTF3-like transcription factor